MDTPSTAESTQASSSPDEVAPGRLSTDQGRAMYLGIARTSWDMLGGREDALATAEAERHLVVMVGRGFDRAVCEARAEGFAWEHIVEHLPGFKTAYGAKAAEKLLESMPSSASASMSAPLASYVDLALEVVKKEPEQPS
ncbi:MAG TPA: hypothetical protein VMZ51_01030 [Acidimicrobiales bacterium]|nr:hypothetical protein [Acidimicrobiales bacterium]